MVRFLAHMLIVSVLAPAMGGAVYAFCEAGWRDTNVVIRLLGSPVGGLVSLLFVWFLVIPLGLLTYPLCLAFHKLGVKHRVLWVLGGATIGWLFGWFIAAWATMPLAISVGSGIPIGAATGLALRDVWFRLDESVLELKESEACAPEDEKDAQT